MVVGVIVAVLGLALGLISGLLIGKGLGQATVSVAGLGVASQEELIVLVAAGYRFDHDLQRARARLAQLEAPNVAVWAASLAGRYIAEGRDEPDIRSLAELARGLGVDTVQMAAYLPTPAPPPTQTPPPADTPTPTAPPTWTAPLPTETAAAPAAVLQAATPSPPPPDTPAPVASATPIPATDTPAPAPAPTDTPEPRANPTLTPKPTVPQAPDWTWTARLVGPGQEGQECSGYGKKMLRVTVLDAAGAQISGVWVREDFTGQYRATGHKGDDPYWGPGEAEFADLDGGRLCIATGDGGTCVSDFTRDLSCHDPPPLDDLWAAGYCGCCEDGITKERCQELFEAGSCLGAGWYYWRVEFKRSQ